MKSTTKMQKICPQQTGGGKGNTGMFIERDSKVCAAGMPSAQASQSVAGCLLHYSLQDEVDALIGDSIKPDEKPLKLPPLRKPLKSDRRHGGTNSEVRDLINPPIKTKFQTLVEDLKTTVYSSYWKKGVGCVPDQVPNLPRNFNTLTTTMGKKTPNHGRLYDLVMPVDPVPDKTRPEKERAYQKDRKYCKPAYDPDKTFGERKKPDHHGKWMKLCLTDNRVTMGLQNTVQNKQLVDFNTTVRAPLGNVLTPTNNIRCVPRGYSFGILKPPDEVPECLASCGNIADKQLLNSCLTSLNTLRKYLSKKFNGMFFTKLYTDLKYHDKSGTGWLPKQFVYDFCNSRFVRFNPSKLEPLLTIFEAVDDTQINYKFFIDMINNKNLEFPNLWANSECNDYRTTYTEMVKPDNVPDERVRAGIPSGRYLDLDYPITPRGYCKADRTYLPEETDIKACLNPSVLTLIGISHRDMYAKRSPKLVRKVFEAIGEQFSDKEFEKIWNTAKEKHSQGWVSYETFRSALDKVNDVGKT